MSEGGKWSGERVSSDSMGWSRSSGRVAFPLSVMGDSSDVGEAGNFVSRQTVQLTWRHPSRHVEKDAVYELGFQRGIQRKIGIRGSLTC